MCHFISVACSIIAVDVILPFKTEQTHRIPFLASTYQHPSHETDHETGEGDLLFHTTLRAPFSVTEDTYPSTNLTHPLLANRTLRDP